MAAPGRQAAAEPGLPPGLEPAADFAHLLQSAGLAVRQVQPSKLAAVFKGARAAALIRTDRGVVQVVVLPGATDAEQISVTYSRAGAATVPHRYQLTGPWLGAAGHTKEAARPVYFTLHQSWYVETSECALEAILKRVLGQDRRPGGP